MKANPYYSDTHEEHERFREAWISRGGGTGEPVYSFIDGIMGTYDVGQLKRVDQVKIMEELGVDAIALVEVHVRLRRSKTYHIGALELGDFEPQVRLRLSIIDKMHDDPIWMGLAIVLDRESVEDTLTILGCGEPVPGPRENADWVSGPMDVPDRNFGEVHWSEPKDSTTSVGQGAIDMLSASELDGGIPGRKKCAIELS